MRDQGLRDAIDVAGGVSALARSLGLSQPSVSNWDRVPAERVLAVESATGIPRALLRPDLHSGGSSAPAAGVEDVDDVDLARAQEYRLLATLLAAPPRRDLLARIAGLKGDASPLGMAHLALAAAAAEADPAAVQREHFHLFVGVGRGELLPYASYYLTGFLHDRPLARLREDLARLAIEASTARGEPEDHIATICEVMAGLADGSLGAGGTEAGAFFERHLRPWGARFFAELELAESARFYKAVGLVGRTFMDIEAAALRLAA